MTVSFLNNSALGKSRKLTPTRSGPFLCTQKNDTVISINRRKIQNDEWKQANNTFYSLKILHTHSYTQGKRGKETCSEYIAFG